MDGFGQKTLSGSGSACHQNGGFAVCDGLNQLENTGHFIVLTDDIIQPEFIFELLTELLVFTYQGLLTACPFNGEQKIIVNDRFCQIVMRSFFIALTALSIVP
jgi:hypothetical protein